MIFVTFSDDIEISAHLLKGSEVKRPGAYGFASFRAESRGRGQLFSALVACEILADIYSWLNF